MAKVSEPLKSDAGKKVLALVPGDFIARCQTEEMSIHGDPAITINEQKLPDYDVEAQLLISVRRLFPFLIIILTLQQHFIIWEKPYPIP